MSFLEVERACVRFFVREAAGRRRELRAVGGVSFGLDEGGTLGLVGESGSGKTTLGRAIMGLLPVSEGSIRFRGRDVGGLRGRAAAAFRREVQMIFQDPYESLNPRLSVEAAVGEGLAIHRLAPRAERPARVAEILRHVGLADEHLHRYPHEFSGGQRQRIGMARALAVSPSLVIADEPVSALDVSVQVQILALLRRLRREMGLAYILIAHDLAVVQAMCERTMVMYLGRIVEAGPSRELFSRPAHPYTEALLSAVPDIDDALAGEGRRPPRQRIILRGDVPTATRIPSGCPFHPRCHRARPVCAESDPVEREVGPGRVSACHFALEM